MKEIWKKYERNMKEIWKKYQRNIKEIWKKYERHMKEIERKNSVFQELEFKEVWNINMKNMTILFGEPMSAGVILLKKKDK